MPLGSITVKFSGAKLKSHRHFFNFGFLLEILITIEIQTFSDCLGLQVKFWHNLKILSRYESKSSVQVYFALWQIDKGTLIVVCVFQIYSSFVRFFLFIEWVDIFFQSTCTCILNVCSKTKKNYSLHLAFIDFPNVKTNPFKCAFNKLTSDKIIFPFAWSVPYYCGLVWKFKESNVIYNRLHVFSIINLIYTNS